MRKPFEKRILTRRSCLRAMGALTALAAWRGRPVLAACEATQANPKGPFHLRGAPFRNDLASPMEPGEKLTVSGRVLSASTCEPLAGSVLDAWHANDAGMYYGMEGRRPTVMEPHLLRARILADEAGRYSFDTILPGYYRLSLTRYRARHIHLILTHADAPSLTTQLYFEGDPHLATDPIAREDLVMKLGSRGDRLTGVFDFYL